MQIKGRTFFVTGGSSGLGAATTAEILLQDGNVVILDLQEPIDTTLPSDRTLFVKTDIRSPEEVSNAIELARKKFGDGVFGGVINAGGVPSVGMTVNRDGTPLDLDTLKFVIDVNLVGTANVATRVAALLAKQRPNENGERGVIINVSSVAYQEGQMGQLAYAASKGGIASMTLPMARDLAFHGIRVVTIAPGLFDTQMSDKLGGDKATIDKVKRHLLNQMEFPKRLGNPKEFAKLAVHLIENSYMNGTVVRLDAGLRMGKL